MQQYYDTTQPNWPTTNLSEEYTEKCVNKLLVLFKKTAVQI